VLFYIGEGKQGRTTYEARVASCFNSATVFVSFPVFAFNFSCVLISTTQVDSTLEYATFFFFGGTGV
jgi:hypothetical protein